jgi:hypothetical protein
MTKKRLLLFGGFLAACVCLPLGVVTVMPDDGPGVTKANFNRIEKGMTKAEVEKIIGKDSTPIGGWGIHTALECWPSNDGATACIYFENERVTDMRWFDSPHSFLVKIRRWLHLP